MKYWKMTCSGSNKQTNQLLFFFFLHNLMGAKRGTIKARSGWKQPSKQLITYMCKIHWIGVGEICTHTQCNTLDWCRRDLYTHSV